MNFNDAFQKWLENAPMIIISVTTAVFGFITANRWRAEHFGKRKAALAEEVLLAALEFEDAMRAIRSPFLISEETTDVTCNTPDSARRVTIYLLKRHQSKAEQFLHLKKKLPACSVYFDDETERLLKSLIQLENDIAALRTTMHHSAKKFLGSPNDINREQFLDSMNRYLETDSGDELMLKASSSIKELRTKLVQYIAE